MRPRFRHIAPDRIQIRQGGGVMTVFGLPFFGAGVFMLLASFGFIPVSNADEVSAVGRIALPLMGLMFTAVGGALSFGRAWTTVDGTRREVIKQWGLLVPMHSDSSRVDDFITVAVEFVRGDSDSADKFPVSLRLRAGKNLQLCSSTQYADSRACATAVATLLRLDFEDATTDHPVRLAAGQADMPLQQRLHMDGLQNEPAPPPDARSQVTRELDGVRITIPTSHSHPIAYVLTLIPVAVSLVFVSPLLRFFRQTRTPEPVGLIFLGFIILFFAVLPAMTALNGFLRSRRGRTIVTVSPRGIDIQERGAWKSGPLNTLTAADILDIDFSTNESVVVSGRVAAEQRVRASSTGTGTASPDIGPRTAWLLTTLSRFAQGHGITVKTRQGLTTFGQGLADDEIRYVHSIVRGALAGN